MHGTLTLHRFNGIEIFAVQEATLYIAKDSDELSLIFAVDTQGVRIRSTCSDTDDLPARPNASIRLSVTSEQVNHLEKTRFALPQSIDEARGCYNATVYYLEHDQLNENQIDVLRRDGNRYQAKWTATTTDVNYYDGSKPNTRVDIDAWFTMLDESM